jgi:hypothetical protein
VREAVLFGEVGGINHVNWVGCHHGMARPQVADGGYGLQIWRVPANILNKQVRPADKRWSSSLCVGSGAIKTVVLQLRGWEWGYKILT